MSLANISSSRSESDFTLKAHIKQEETSKNLSLLSLIGMIFFFGIIATGFSFIIIEDRKNLSKELKSKNEK